MEFSVKNQHKPMDNQTKKTKKHPKNLNIPQKSYLNQESPPQKESDAESSQDDSGKEDSDVDIQSEVSLTEREVIRNQISTMSFEDLQKLKEKIGSKEYNQVVFGTKPKKASTTFKRANKNRPREVSSKRRSRNQDQLIQTKPTISRDPRFDPLCGTYDEKEFKSNYKFLKDVKKKERVQLAEEYKNETDPKRQQKIKYLMQRLDNQIREEEKRDKQRLNKEEEQQDIKRQLMQGEKPVFKKKSEKRIEDLVNKYEELKKSNKLQKHLERRYKKLAKKDRQNMESAMS